MKVLIALVILLSIPVGLFFLFTMPVAVSGPTTVGGLMLEFMLVDLIFGISKNKQS